MTKAIATLACLALALGACKGEQKKATGGSAQGEVLPGALSDAMLPLDTVKSQAPLAPKSEGGEKGDAKPAKPGAKPSASAASDAPAAADAPEEKPAEQE